MGFAGEGMRTMKANRALLATSSFFTASIFRTPLKHRIGGLKNKLSKAAKLRIKSNRMWRTIKVAVLLGSILSASAIGMLLFS